MQDGRTLFADDRSQVYLGKGSLDGRADALARATCGQLLMRLGKVVHAYYHSTCGGRTQKASTVFGGNDDDATAERDCPYCRHSPRYQWQVPLERALLARAFGVGDDAVLTLTLDAEQKLLTLATAGGPTSLSWEQFRRRYNAAAETSVLHSAQFVELKCTADTLVLSGRGFGHGVGLCQYGADGMARTGASYREILSFYYPSADVRTCW
ncbi:MAG: SpoIID/LytB domain-containing protein [Planctomycetota bacterium]